MTGAPLAPGELIRGPKAIACHLGISTRLVVHLHCQHHLPTMRLRGEICATPAALSEWLDLAAAGVVPGVTFAGRVSG